MKKPEVNVNVARYNAETSKGLDSDIVKQRIKDKLTNKVKQKTGKSVFRIFYDNIFTFFNLIWLLIFIALILVQTKVQNLLFIVIIFINTFIAIVQEIKAKITVHKLSLVTMPKVKVIRNSKMLEVYSTKLVLDDVIKLEIGDTIPADCIVLDGKVEVNESLLTGESDGIMKNVSNSLLGGSFIVSGMCFAKVDKVGKDSYIQSVAQEAKNFKSPSSNLFRDLNAITKYIAFGILPIGALLFLNNYFASGRNLFAAVEQTCGALTGMIPAGIYLLITLALALGIVRLAKKRTLVKDLYSIEMLARSNVLCLDKTGTITDGTMQVTEVIELDKIGTTNTNQIVSNILYNQQTSNATTTALIDYFGKQTNWNVKQNLEFSSKRKITATTFEKIGTFIIGAPEFTNCNYSTKIKNQIFKHSSEGKRVLMLAHSKKAIKGEDNIPQDTNAVALVIIEDHIREDAKKTIEWFKNNDVEIKIISGDNPITVANIAKRVSVDNADKCISLEGLSLQEVEKIADKFTVFGRVSPEQKHTIIKALKNKGKVVAMTGDGVNDTLALKESDCSIAMADGSAVARDLSKLVLLDSKFSSLPEVVKEGRQVINNVQQSSSLYLMKTIFTMLLSFMTLVTFTQYPFAPSQILILEFFVIGVPSVMLALQPNTKIIKGEFIPVVLKRAMPSGFLMFLNVFLVLIFKNFLIINVIEIQTATTLVLTLTGLVNLFFLCLPLTKLRTITLSISSVGIFFAYLFLGKSFGVSVLTLNVAIIVICALAVAFPANYLAPKISKVIDNIRVSLGLKDIVEVMADAAIKKEKNKEVADKTKKENTVNTKKSKQTLQKKVIKTTAKDKTKSS